MPLPEPKAGLVISYSYLWRHEAAAGATEGRKIRPCAIVLVVQRGEGNDRTVAVAPITHTIPYDSSVAVEIPVSVKRHLGLDDERSWIVLDDFNVFDWPGFDLAPVPGERGKYDYGALPPRFFQDVIAKFSELRRHKRSKSTIRD
jgi:hypothetical protein